MDEPEIAWAFTAFITELVSEEPTPYLKAKAIEYYTSGAWAKALEIGKTGLAELNMVSEQVHPRCGAGEANVKYLSVLSKAPQN